MSWQRGAVLCASTAVAVASAAALSIVATGSAGEARSLLQLRPDQVHLSAHDLTAIVLRNGTIVAGTLVSAELAPKVVAPFRWLLFVVLALLLTVNATLVGIAAVAYGEALVRVIAPHVLLEWGSMSIAGGAYLAACGAQPVSKVAVTNSTALVLLAATVEVWSPLATRP